MPSLNTWNLQATKLTDQAHMCWPFLFFMKASLKDTGVTLPGLPNKNYKEARTAGVHNRIPLKARAVLYLTVFLHNHCAHTC